jgi:amino acid adenylation domain-containing protein/FkbH-like protein
MAEKFATQPQSGRSDAREALLAQRLHAAANVTPTPTIPVRHSNQAPLSFAQERLWFLDQLEPNSSLYTMPLAFRLVGPLRPAALEQALGQIVQRHQILRTRFVALNGAPVQIVEPSARFKLTLVELGGETLDKLHSHLATVAARPFDLSEDLMLRATVFRRDANEHVLLLTMHHIASDAWSWAIFLRELTEHYRAAVSGSEAAVSELIIQYADYAAWERGQFATGKLEPELAYWRRHLRDVPVLLDLPTDHGRPVVQSFRGARESILLEPGLPPQLNALARREGVTLYLLLLAAFKTLLYRYTRREDLVIGTPVAGRTEVETETLIGFFVRTLVLRSDLSGGPTFRELLKRVQQVMLDAHAHQDLPFEKLVEELRPTRSPGFAPLVQVMFAFQNTPALELNLPDVQATTLELPGQTAKFDLTLFAEETPGALRLTAEYSTDLFAAATIIRLLRHFEILLAGIVANPEQRISELPLLGPSERHQLLDEWNRTAVDYPRNKTVARLFAEQVERTPDAVAVELQETRLTYRQFNERANQLAQHLQSLGVAPDVLVAVALERSVDFIVALVAILKAGGAYVALDPLHPEERLGLTLEEARPRVLLTTVEFRNRFAATEGKFTTLCLDELAPTLAERSKTNPPNEASAAHLAYVCFTSGSTGGPKGVCIPHRAVVRLVWNTDYLQLGPDDVVAQLSNCAFDAATFEIWGALLNGARLQIFPAQLLLAPKQFQAELERTGVTALFVTTALFNQLTQEQPGIFASVRTVLFGGDTANPRRVAEVLKQGRPARLLNVYGPTECTTFATWHEVHEVLDPDLTVPIGRPIANTEAFVLDQNLQPVPIGVPGELYLGGDGLAREYLNRPEFTATKFILHPFANPAVQSANEKPHEPALERARLYRTGDMVRYRADGQLEFLGRTDLQVKLRGFRVELREIETALARHSGVADCAVTLDCSEAAEKRLVAYVVSNATPTNADELRLFLRAKLPDFMLPAAFVFVPALPLNANGKIDRAALPALVPDHPGSERQFIAPRDVVETRLGLIWQELLNTKPIGALDNFFDLGGHSLMAIRLLARVEKEMGKSLPVATLFQAPTLGEFAHAIKTAEAARLSESTSLVPIQPNGARPPLFLVHGAGGGMFWGYTNLARHLGDDQPVYAFRSRGLDGLPEFASIQEMATAYVANLRSFRPHGPYCLGGYCFGGNVAYEMARQLRATGETVAVLALLNSIPPDSHYRNAEFSFRWWGRFFKNLGYLLRWHFHRTPAQRRDYLRWQFNTLRGKICRCFGSKKFPPLNVAELVDLSASAPEERPAWDAHVQALFNHHTQPYDGEMTLLRSGGHQFWCSYDPAYGWRDVAKGNLTIRTVAGAHEQILEEPFVQSLAEELKQVLDHAAQVTPVVPTAMPAPPSQADVSEAGTLPQSLAIAKLPVPSNAVPAATVMKVFPELETEQKQLAYWRNQLAGAATLELPADQPRAGQSDAIERIPFALSANLVGNLERLSRREQTTLFAALLAALFALLCRYTGNADVAVAAKMSGARRSRSDENHRDAGAILPLRGNLSDQPSFRELLRRTTMTIADAQANCAPSLEKILATVWPECDRKHCPFLPVCFNFLAKPAPVNGQTELNLVSTATNEGALGFALTLRLVRGTDGLAGEIEFNSARFQAARIVRMAKHFETLLAAALATPDQPISTLPLLPEEERRQLLSAFNDTHREYPRAVTLPKLFEAQVERTPDAVALIAGDERLSYRDLNARANQVAHYLHTLGVGPETLVGICVERSWRMVAGILGILKAGGAYVPMDPTYPKDRLEFMLADAKAPVLLTQQNLLALFPTPYDATNTRKVICLDSDWYEIASCGADNLESAATADNLAYVIYTSGSTGKPKGVAIEHRAPVALLHWARETFSREEIAGVLGATSMCFDLSIFEMFVPLSWGGTLILADNAIALASLPAAPEVTLVNTVPSALRELLRVKGVPASVRVINLAGEPLTTELADQIYAETAVQKVYDLYGPTETTTYSTGTLRERGAAPTIGRPLANEQVFILDAQRQLLPIGVPGELYIGGDGLARGYLHRPELTAEKFVAHPFQEGARVYRTGDLARWRADGNLEFLGRMDHQVKIRGFRIELGEIETLLRQHSEIAEVIVVAQEGQAGDKQLAAYVVVHPASQLSVGTLREYLKQRLPEYMVPPHIVFLETMPLTPNGKVDRKALPKIQPTRQAETERVLPRNAVETSLAAIWREVLGLDQVGVHDDFFELGGHSLLAIQVVSRIRAEFHIEVPLHALFDQPTIAALAEGMNSGEWTKQVAVVHPLQRISRREPAPASFVQERLWVLDQFEPGSNAYHVPLALRLKGELNQAALEQALDEIVRRHEALRTVFALAGENVVQVLQPPAHLPVQRVDLRTSSEAERENEAQKIVAAEVHKPFDLARGPLVRATLIKLAANDHVFCVVMHHAISDGWSFAIFFRELEALYQAHVAGRPVPALPELSIQSADHAQWQREMLQGATLESEVTWWKNALTGAPAAIELPHDSITPAPERAGALVIAKLSPEFSAAFDAFCQSQRSTPFMVCLTALAITLEKWTQQNDLVIGTVVAGRNRRELENVIGCFMNFLPLRLKLDETQTGRELLAQTRAVVLDAQTHQECPFQKIVEVVNPKRRTDQNPLYNVALLLQNFPTRLFQSEKLTSEVLLIEPETALLDLRFEVEEVAGGQQLRCEYKPKLFTAETATWLLASFQRVLQTLVEQPETKLTEFALAENSASRVSNAEPISPAQSQSGGERVLVTATFTAEFLAEPFQHWMKELEFPTEMEFAPYGQVFQQLLDPKSLLASNARGLNVVLVRLDDWAQSPATNGQTDDPEAEIERKVRDLLLALKGAAARSVAPYLLGLCPSAKTQHEQSRRTTFLTRMETRLAAEFRSVNNVYVVTTAELFDLYPVADYYDAQGDELGHVPYTPAFFTALATMIARRYHALKQPPCKVIALDCDQTLWSGVCGEDGPGGVQLDAPRRALQEFMHGQLAVGRLLCLCSKNNEGDVAAVFERRADMPLRPEHFVARQINWNPKSANLRAVSKELNLGVEGIVLVDDNPTECAEVAANCPGAVTLQLPEDPTLIPQFLKHCWVFDGPKVTGEDTQRTALYQQNHEREVLRQESLSFADFLAALELKIEIAAMAPEELARVTQLLQRTNQFNTTTRRRSEGELRQSIEREGLEVRTVRVKDRFGDYGLVGVMIFKTASAALDVDSLLLSCRVLGKGVEHRMLADLGRLSRERGLPHVRVHFTPSAKNNPAREFLDDVAASFRQAQNGGFVYALPVEIAERITFRPAPSSEARENSPSANAPVAAPLNGKRFDRWRWIALEANDPHKILAQIKAKQTPRSRQSFNGTPVNELETQLCELWQELLRLDRVGTHDDFFELGGHSFLAVRLFAQIETLTGKRLPVVTIFQTPTIAQLAERIGQMSPLAVPPALIIPIQPQGTRPPLFLVHGAGGDALWGYANLAQQLGTEQPVYGIQPRATDAPDKFETLEAMAADYVAELREFQPQGPYCLGGYCFGGNLAYEMARQLQALGADVAFLALIESTPEGGTYERMDWWRPDFTFRFARNLYFCARDFLGYTPEERRSLVRRKIKVLARKTWDRVRGQRTALDLDDVIDSRKFPEHELRLWDAHLRLLIKHQSQPYVGPVTVFRTAAHPLFSSYQNDLGWGALVADGVTVKIVSGSHGNIFHEPNVRDLARNVAATLESIPRLATVPEPQLQTA